MAGTKGKKQKGTIIERTVKRLSRMHAYENLLKKVSRWVNDETSDVMKPQLVSLQATLNAAALTHDNVIKLFSTLTNEKYTPPKKNFSGTIKLDTGKHVWIKPQYVKPYAEIYDKSQLDDLHIVKTAENKIVLALGNPEQNDKVATFIVSKAILMANAPEEVAA